MELQEDPNQRDAVPGNICHLCKVPFTPLQLEEKHYIKYRALCPIRIPDFNGEMKECILLRTQYQCDSCSLET